MRRERVEIHPVDTRTGVRAGQLLGSAGAGSELAGGAVVATVDPDDLGRLAAHATHVTIAEIG